MAGTVIAVPCFNEEERLPRGAIAEFLEAEPGVDLLLVDDGSTDGTLDALEELAARHPGRIGVLGMSPNQGKAEAVRALRGRVLLLRHVARRGSAVPGRMTLPSEDRAGPLRLQAVVEQLDEGLLVLDLLDDDGDALLAEAGLERLEAAQAFFGVFAFQQGGGDLDEAVRDWRNPVAEIVIRRVSR